MRTSPQSSSTTEIRRWGTVHADEPEKLCHREPRIVRGGMITALYNPALLVLPLPIEPIPQPIGRTSLGSPPLWRPSHRLSHGTDRPSAAPHHPAAPTTR